MFLIYGSDNFLINKQINKLIKTFDKNKIYHILKFQITPNNVEQLLTMILMPSLFHKNRIIIIEDCWFLTNVKDLQLSTLQINHLMKCLESHKNPELRLFFVVNNDDIDHRKKIVKFFHKNSKVLAVKNLNETQLSLFVNNFFLKNNTSINDDALKLLLERLPNSLQITVNELNKLVNYQNHLIYQDVDLLVSHYLDSNIFLLVNAILFQDFNEMWERYQTFKINNSDVLAMIGLLASQLRLIKNAKIYQEKKVTFNDISQKLAINPYRLKLVWQKLTTISISQINYLLENLSILDYNIKNNVINKNIGFEIFLLKI